MNLEIVLLHLNNINYKGVIIILAAGKTQNCYNKIVIKL